MAKVKWYQNVRLKHGVRLNGVLLSPLDVIASCDQATLDELGDAVASADPAPGPPVEAGEPGTAADPGALPEAKPAGSVG